MLSNRQGSLGLQQTTTAWKRINKNCTRYKKPKCSLPSFVMFFDTVFFVVRILYYLQSCLLHAITTYNCAFAKFTVGIIISLSPM